MSQQNTSPAVKANNGNIKNELFPSTSAHSKSSLIHNLPAANIKDLHAHYEIELAAPGFKKDNFMVNINKQVVTISADKKPSERKKFVQREFKYGSFKRTFALPLPIHKKKLKMYYKNGILLLSVSKKKTT
ncbi:Hsp20/alpha crystallin family protein [Cytophaga aurantiaca]|uniref:Hsp20/alpha crystallin family protein n=1 Tax=Cytophaga aurantiaca TaxID=29530 RepID=UPI00036C0F93|nr:Hsp20/alpha crystallin family protein [Cytophaga aurantiaca]